MRGRRDPGALVATRNGDGGGGHLGRAVGDGRRVLEAELDTGLGASSSSTTVAGVAVGAVGADGDGALPAMFAGAVHIVRVVVGAVSSCGSRHGRGDGRSSVYW